GLPLGTAQGVGAGGKLAGGAGAVVQLLDASLLADAPVEIGPLAALLPGHGALSPVLCRGPVRRRTPVSGPGGRRGACPLSLFCRKVVSPSSPSGPISANRSLPRLRAFWIA